MQRLIDRTIILPFSIAYPIEYSTKKSWILMIGYVPDASCAKMEEDFLKILKSAK
jgi:hypothetical protein